MIKRTLTLVLTLTIAALVGCGGESDEAERAGDSSPSAGTENPQATQEQEPAAEGDPATSESETASQSQAAIRKMDAAIRTAYKQKDVTKLCSLFTKQLRAEFAGTTESCEQGMPHAMQAIGDNPPFPSIEFIRVDGDTAQIRYASGAVHSAKRDLGWKLGPMQR